MLRSSVCAALVASSFAFAPAATPTFTVRCCMRTTVYSSLWTMFPVMHAVLAAPI